VRSAKSAITEGARSATSAERMRQSRQRQKGGGVLVTIDLDATSIARLIALGWLPEDRKRDRAAVSAAFAAFVRHGLGVGERPADPPRPLAAPEYQPTLSELLSAALARRRSAAS
jgi:hypothetical protein